MFVEGVDWSSAGGRIADLRKSIAPELGVEDEWDYAAPQIIAHRDGVLVGAVRLILAGSARLDFEPALPVTIPKQIRSEIVVASRFMIAPSEALGIRSVAFQLIRTAWLIAWPLGCRAGLVCAPEKLVTFYRRTIGVIPIGEPILHPRTGRKVQLMRYIPEAGGNGVIDDIVSQLPGPEVSLTLKSWFSDLESRNADR